MRKNLTVDELQTKLDKLKAEIKDQRKKAKAELIKKQECEQLKAGKIVFKYLNGSNSISVDVCEDIFANIISNNAATMNLIALRLKKAATETEREGMS